MRAKAREVVFLSSPESDPRSASGLVVRGSAVNGATDKSSCEMGKIPLLLTIPTKAIAFNHVARDSTGSPLRQFSEP